MSWDIERAKSWVEQWAHPIFQFTCLFEHFETLQLTHLGFLLQQISYLLLLFLEFSQLFLVLDCDPKQWLIVLTHHPPIPHALQHIFIWYLAVRSATSQTLKPKLKEWIWVSTGSAASVMTTWKIAQSLYHFFLHLLLCLFRYLSPVEVLIFYILKSLYYVRPPHSSTL